MHVQHTQKRVISRSGSIHSMWRSGGTWRCNYVSAEDAFSWKRNVEAISTVGNPECATPGASTGVEVQSCDAATDCRCAMYFSPPFDQDCNLRKDENTAMPEVTDRSIRDLYDADHQFRCASQCQCVRQKSCRASPPAMYSTGATCGGSSRRQIESLVDKVPSAGAYLSMSLFSGSPRDRAACTGTKNIHTLR